MTSTRLSNRVAAEVMVGRVVSQFAELTTFTAATEVCAAPMGWLALMLVTVIPGPVAMATAKGRPNQSVAGDAVSNLEVQWTGRVRGTAAGAFITEPWLYKLPPTDQAAPDANWKLAVVRAGSGASVRTAVWSTWEAPVKASRRVPMVAMAGRVVPK